MSETTRRVHTWRHAARVLGMTQETLKKRRDEHKCPIRGRPFFRSEEAVLEWYEQLIAPPETPEPKARPRTEPKRRRNTGAAIDPREVERALRSGRKT